METITAEGHEFQFTAVPLEHCKLLILKAPHGFLGCGLVDLSAADKFGEAAAVVTGVACAEDMLNASVRRVSAAAAKRGAVPGMTGREALLKFL